MLRGLGGCERRAAFLRHESLQQCLEAIGVLWGLELVHWQ